MVGGGQGGPQSQVPTMQRSGSPPRPPCYGQQLPYNPEAVYYNVPVYGAVEGPAVYQDALDMGPNGALAEDAFALDECVHQDLGRPTKEQLNSDTARQSNTPVVSLLSLDQHQEKDFMSMQSGRRRKSITTNNNNGYTNTAITNTTSATTTGYYNFYPSNNFNPFHSFVTHTPGGNNNTTEYGFNNNKPVVNGYQDKSSWMRKRNRNDRRSLETTSSLSSLRTDSNSSASAPDDFSNTPPPPPYSPMINNNKLYNTKNYHATSSSRPKTYGGPITNSRRPPASVVKCVPVNSLVADSSVVSPSVFIPPCKPPVSSPPQVHAQQHFIPPARRNRRSVRRNNAPQPLSEIGAGDAPLPNAAAAAAAAADVSDACKKLDGLKL